MMVDLKGKKVLVTGSTQGIGLELAKSLSDCGAIVYINGAASEQKINDVVKTIPNAMPALGDLATPDCAQKLYELTGDIDILVLNASIQYRTAWDEIDDEEFDKQMTVNFKSSLKLIQKYVPYMKKQKWGRVITIGSVQQAKPHKDMLVYAASKAAQNNMVINLAKQLAPFNITVNNVAPGVIETPRNFDALADNEYAKNVLSGIPCGYAGCSKDCTGIILLLCSDEGRYITGENLFIDGGMKL